MRDERPTESDSQPRARRNVMRVALMAYLVAYYLAIGGAVVTLWRSGLIAHVDPAWTVGTVVFAVTLGGLLAWVSRS